MRNKRKQVLFILFVFFLGKGILYAQGAGQLTFEGVPIKMGYASFVKKMTSRGYEVEYRNSESCSLTGLYGENKVHVFKDTTNGMVKAVAVQVCDDGDLFYSRIGACDKLKRQYNRLKNKLTTEYGKPIEIDKRKTYYSRSDCNGAFDKSYDWPCNDGFISLDVDDMGVEHCVRVFYIVK